MIIKPQIIAKYISFLFEKMDFLSCISSFIAKIGGRIIKKAPKRINTILIISFKMFLNVSKAIHPTNSTRNAAIE